MIVQPVKESPPSDLLACAQRPIGFPEDTAAWLEGSRPDVLAALERVMRAFGENADQLDRLVSWHAERCRD